MAKELNEQEMASVVGGIGQEQYIVRCKIQGADRTIGPMSKADAERAANQVKVANGVCGPVVRV